MNQEQQLIRSNLLKIVLTHIIKLILPIIFIGSSNCHAAIFHVNVTVQDNVDTNPGDGICSTISSGAFCTLRAAVMESNANPGPDVIILPGNNAEIMLNIPGNGNSAASGDLDIKDTLTIGTFVVPEDELPTINATQMNNRVFDIRPGVEMFALQNVILSGGVSTNGGAMYVRDGVGDVDIKRVKFNSNTANTNGGAIFNLGANITVEDSVFIENRALVSGAAIYDDCGFILMNQVTVANSFGHPLNPDFVAAVHVTKDQSPRNQCLLSISNTTLSGSDAGSGVLLYDPPATVVMDLVLENTSIIDNKYGVYFNADAHLTMRNTLLTQSEFSNCTQIQDVSVSTSSSNNLDDGTTCFELLGGSSHINADPELELLQFDTLGWHQYAIPQEESIVVDRGQWDPLTFICVGADQRGLDRPLDGDGDGINECDIGAIEQVPNLWLFKDSFED